MGELTDNMKNVTFVILSTDGFFEARKQLEIKYGRDVTLPELAAKTKEYAPVGMHHQAIGRIFNGKTKNISLFNLFLLAKALETNPEILLGYDYRSLLNKND